MIRALRNEALSSSSIYLEEKDRFWPWRDTAVQQQNLGTLWCTNDASMQENIPHMTPPPAGTADTRQDGFTLFTQKICPAISMSQ